MFGLQMLDVALGIIFVYLLLSLVCSAVNEIIEAFLKNRANDLARGIRELLSDPDGHGLSKFLYEHPLIFGLYLGKYRPLGKNLPSYIPARNFALALLDIVLAPDGENPPTGAVTAAGRTAAMREAIRRSDKISPNVKQALLILVNAAGDNPGQVVDNIENWYNSAMDRVAGWYKRRVQMIILMLGLATTAAVNADTIAIFKSLANDPPLRESLVAAAQEYAKSSGTSAGGEKPEDRIRRNLKEIQQYSLPIGWDKTDPRTVPVTFPDWLLKVTGWLLTAVAISLGAPFWFDLLNKFMVVRSTVKPHEKSPEEASEDRQA